MTTISSTSGAASNRTATTTHRLGSETKSAFKTTEFMSFVAAVVGVLVASLLVGSDGPAGDVFQADRAWMLVTALTIGYMISRGLAKSGSRAARDED
jgi:hypothetical protein